jgi:hypothetical protein
MIIKATLVKRKNTKNRSGLIDLTLKSITQNKKAVDISGRFFY